MAPILFRHVLGWMNHNRPFNSHQKFIYKVCRKCGPRLRDLGPWRPLATGGALLFDHPCTNGKKSTECVNSSVARFARKFLRKFPRPMCSQTRKKLPEELAQKLYSKPCNRAIDTLFIWCKFPQDRFRLLDNVGPDRDALLSESLSRRRWEKKLFELWR